MYGGKINKQKHFSIITLSKNWEYKIYLKTNISTENYLYYRNVPRNRSVELTVVVSTSSAFHIGHHGPVCASEALIGSKTLHRIFRKGCSMVRRFGVNY